MNTKNTKTAVIVLLITANIFFIFNIINYNINSENIPSEMINDAVSILEKNEFIADRGKIPAKKPSSIIYEGVYEGVYTQNSADIIKNFSGISEEELNETDYMLLPAGISYTAGNYRFVFDNPEKHNQDYFKISIIDKSYPDPDETEDKTESLFKKGISGAAKNDIKKAEKIIRNFLKKYQNQDVKLSFEIVGYEQNKNKNFESILINQSFDGVKIYSHAVYIEIQGSEVKYFSGRWYFGGFIGKLPMPLLDSVNILFKYIETGENVIQENGGLNKMNLEYTVMRHETDKFYLVPAWQIIFDGGKEFSYNMVTGDKINKE